MFPVQAHQATAHPNVQSVPPGALGKGQQIHVPGSHHRHVRQRVEYGKGLRQGHSVSGPYGDIIIWSPQTTNDYGAQPRPRFGPMHQPRRPPTHPRFEYRGGHGD